MKAVVCTKYGPPEVLQLTEVEKPKPKDNEILIKIFAAAVSSSDCFTRDIRVLPLAFWLPARMALGFSKPRRSILGLVLAGDIEAIGKNVTRFKKGDPVWAYPGMRFGAYAEYTCLLENGNIGPKDALVALKPANVTYEEAAAIPYGGTLAMHFLVRKGNIKNGQRILIYGASGAVGSSAVQLAKHCGAYVTGVCSTGNVALVKSLGADTVIDYTKNELVQTLEEYDLVFDAVGKRKSSALKLRCKKALRPNGKYLSVDDGSPKLLIEDFILLKDMVETGKLKPVIDRCYPLEETAQAHRYVEKGHKKGNVIITIKHSDKSP
jgi:NADPH:quinone reductase-like Zn-dependent oxidoreductase